MSDSACLAQQGKMEKQVIGSMGLSWQLRIAVMDRNYLYFAKDDDPVRTIMLTRTHLPCQPHNYVLSLACAGLRLGLHSSLGN
jgi:hypothetical protein